jgi:hypothetical protein
MPIDLQLRDPMLVQQRAGLADLVLAAGLVDVLAATRPRMRSRSGSTTSPPSMIGVISRPFSVPQSGSVTTMSWATSTSRRVR